MDDDTESDAGGRVRFCLNGQTVDADPQAWTLGRFLRDELALSAVKIACEEGSCGACTVLCDGQPVSSCVFPLGLCNGHVFETADYLARTSPDGRRVAEVLTARSPMQCGFCTPGLLCTLTALIRVCADRSESHRGALSRSDVAAELSAHLCRCTGYVGYLDCASELLNDV
ncbi:(2Fe-2S)-binding protein [Mycolicibacterium boenickei]